MLNFHFLNNSCVRGINAPLKVTLFKGKFLIFTRPRGMRQRLAPEFILPIGVALVRKLEGLNVFPKTILKRFQIE